MNKTNLESKHFCDDFRGIRNVLKKLDAKKQEIVNQEDTFFSLSKEKEKSGARLKLRKERESNTLVYYERPLFKKTKGVSADIILHPTDDRKLEQFLGSVLGVRGIVKKKREIWRKGNTVFHLDIVKGVGGIFEIELQKRGHITKKDIEIFEVYRKKLSPYLGRVVKGSNIDLVLSKKL